VICVDEFGPLNLMPRPGKGWNPHTQPNRLRATYTRTAGVRHMSAALDLASCAAASRPDSSTRSVTTTVRTRRPRSPPGAQQRHRAGVHPSKASWLNWIECEFTALRYFVLDGSDNPTHAAQERPIAAYPRWRNKHTQPKRHFAIGSKIRHPDYLPYQPDPALGR
jgi:hypothetical protein